MREPGEERMNTMAPSTARQPAWFWLVAVLALLWNLFGLAMFYLSVTMTPEQLAQLPQAQREVTEGYPTWLWGVYGVAVAAGTLGSLLMLLRRKLALPVFWISLVAVVVLFAYSLFPGRMLELMGPAQALPMPVAVTLVAVLLVWFARRSIARGWLA
jgi:hypothetical protein